MQDLLDDLEYFNNLLKESEYKENEVIMIKKIFLHTIKKVRR